MQGFYTVIGRQLTESEVVQLLQALFPAARIVTLDTLIAGDALPAGMRWQDIADMVYSVHRPTGEFPTLIDFCLFPGADSDYSTIAISVARCVSDHLGCPTLCDGTGIGDTAAPYWSVLCTQGQWFLADDADTDFADGSGGPVRIVREISPPCFPLDVQGNLLTAS